MGFFYNSLIMIKRWRSLALTDSTWKGFRGQAYSNFWAAFDLLCIKVLRDLHSLFCLEGWRHGRRQSGCHANSVAPSSTTTALSPLTEHLSVLQYPTYTLRGICISKLPSSTCWFWAISGWSTKLMSSTVVIKEQKGIVYFLCSFLSKQIVNFSLLL